MSNLDKIIAELAAIDSTAWKAQLNMPTIDIRSKESEVVIFGNKAGLVHLALQLLRTANSDVVGAHYHLDEVSLADVAEINVVFTLN